MTNYLKTSMKKPIIVVGMQWGDEGKGKIVDYLAKKSDYVVRFNGGDNAGHTVVLNGHSYKFHNLPSGVIQNKKVFIAQGAVINPHILLSEIELINKAGFDVDLSIDYRTHIVMPYHKLLDAATEAWKGKKATGSLKLGIGYCYEDKNNRTGIRVEDLIKPNILKEKVRTFFPLKKKIIERVYGQKVTLGPDSIIKQYIQYGKKLAPYASDVSEIIAANLGKKNMIFEGAHGTFLDPAFGSYPYTVAPYCIAAAAFTGIGIGPISVGVMGVVKAYTTRVGNGQFPTEQNNTSGQTMQRVGKEIGTTSGRTRRCGWLDLPMLRTAMRLNNCSTLALTKLDVLSSFREIPIATAYIKGKNKFAYFPPQINELSGKKPKYVILRGWQQDISKLRHFKDLPKYCKEYIKFMETQLAIPIKLISVGADRNSIITH